MLVLSRKKNESIIIAQYDLEIVFLGFGKWDEGKLGFIAPKNVTIDRKEIYELKKEAELGKNKENFNLVLKTLKSF